MAKKSKIEEELEQLPPYITVELSAKNVIVAHKVIGTKSQFNLTCRCKNRATANRLTDKLNELEAPKR